MRKVLIGAVGTVLGLGIGILGARGFDWSVFHPEGVVVRENARITYVGVPNPGDEMAIFTSVGGFETTPDVWEGDLLAKVRQEQSRTVSISVTITYAIPEQGVSKALYIAAPSED